MAEPEDTKRPGSDRPMRRPQSGYRPGGEIVGRSNTGRPTSEDAARFGLDKTKPASADSLRSAEAGARDDTRTIHNNPIREAEHAAITPNLREAEETGADESDGGLYNAGGDDSVSTEAQSSRGPR